jgi:NTP pyrophosphatase (non-canonical NTP hydrolase)
MSDLFRREFYRCAQALGLWPASPGPTGSAGEPSAREIGDTRYFLWRDNEGRYVILRHEPDGSLFGLPTAYEDRDDAIQQRDEFNASWRAAAGRGGAPHDPASHDGPMSGGRCSNCAAPSPAPARVCVPVDRSGPHDGWLPGSVDVAELLARRNRDHVMWFEIEALCNALLTPSPGPTGSAGEPSEWSIPELVAQFWKDESNVEPTEDEMETLMRFAAWMFKHEMVPVERSAALGGSAGEPSEQAVERGVEAWMALAGSTTSDQVDPMKLVVREVLRAAAAGAAPADAEIANLRQLLGTAYQQMQRAGITVADLVGAAPASPGVRERAGLCEVFAVNHARCISPEGFNHPLDSWSIAEWTNAIAGEVGEACNLAKKLIRFRDGVRGNTKPGDQDPDSVKRRIAEELADVVIYADLTMRALGFDIEVVVVEAFNRKSAELGLPFLAALAAEGEQEDQHGR